jgi:hypothetical protein
MLNDLLDACLRLADSRHEKTRALARELLNDWDPFWVILDHPELPLTNNEAERALVPRGHCPTPRQGHAYPAGHPRLRALGQCHRDLPQTESLALELSCPGRTPTA